jgi:flagellar basal-body rod protein FlgF
VRSRADELQVSAQSRRNRVSTSYVNQIGTRFKTARRDASRFGSAAHIDLFPQVFSKRFADCTPSAGIVQVDPLLISAASGMKARLESLDMLANNISNSGTVGYKSDREFYGLYQQQLPVIENQWTDFSQGTLTPTGNPLSLALSGKGMFALNSPTGTVYTRNGDFQISKDNQLAAKDGYTLRNVIDQGKPITVDPAQAVDISKTGVVSQGGQDLGQIEIGAPESTPQILSKLGTTYFALTDKTAAVAAAPDAEVNQGQLEQSNVPVSESAVKLVGVMRQFEMLQKAISLDTDMSKRAIEEVAKVS